MHQSRENRAAPSLSSCTERKVTSCPYGRRNHANLVGHWHLGSAATWPRPGPPTTPVASAAAAIGSLKPAGSKSWLAIRAAAAAAASTTESRKGKRGGGGKLFQTVSAILAANVWPHITCKCKHSKLGKNNIYIYIYISLSLSSTINSCPCCREARKHTAKHIQLETDIIVQYQLQSCPPQGRNIGNFANYGLSFTEITGGRKAIPNELKGHVKQRKKKTSTMKSIWSTPLLDTLGQDRAKASKIETSMSNASFSNLPFGPARKLPTCGQREWKSQKSADHESTLEYLDSHPKGSQ